MSASAIDTPLLRPRRVATQEVGYWAMVLLCFTEGTLFAVLLSSYFFLGVANAAWPPAGVERPKLAKPLIMTALLLSSSAVLMFAEKGRRQGQRARYIGATLVTIALGLGFLGLQTSEYLDKLQHLKPQANAYASMFYTITGFHGTHVAFGLLMLIWTVIADGRGRLAVHEPLAVRNTALYWHFVDAVWLVILTCLYLTPRWY